MSNRITDAARSGLKQMVQTRSAYVVSRSDGAAIAVIRKFHSVPYFRATLLRALETEYCVDTVAIKEVRLFNSAFTVELHIAVVDDAGEEVDHLIHCEAVTIY